MGGPELSIVIPVFNEEAVIPALIERLRSFVARLTPLVTEIILVDDNSTDGTREIIYELAAEDPRVRPIVRSPPNGVDAITMVSDLPSGNSRQP